MEIFNLTILLTVLVQLFCTIKSNHVQADHWDDIEELRSEVRELKTAIIEIQKEREIQNKLFKSLLLPPKAQLYSGVHQTGGSEEYNMSPNSYEVGCKNVEIPVKSINTFDTCIRIYSEQDCQGVSNTIDTRSPQDRIKDIFMFPVKSVSPCYKSDFLSGGQFSLVSTLAGDKPGAPPSGYLIGTPFGGGIYVAPCTDDDCMYAGIRQGCVCQRGCEGRFQYSTFTCKTISV